MKKIVVLLVLMQTICFASPCPTHQQPKKCKGCHGCNPFFFIAPPDYNSGPPDYYFNTSEYYDLYYDKGIEIYPKGQCNCTIPK